MNPISAADAVAILARQRQLAAARNAARRQRLAEEGIKPVTVFLPIALHKQLRDMARQLLQQHDTKSVPPSVTKTITPSITEQSPASSTSSITDGAKAKGGKSGGSGKVKAEVKAEAVRAMLADELTTRGAAAKYGVSHGTAHNWRKEAEAPAKAQAPG